MIIAIWPLLIAIIGLLLWLLVQSPKVQQVGWFLFQAGTFWTVYTLVGHTMKVG